MGTFRLLCGWSHPAGVDQRQAAFLAQISPTLTSKVAVFPAHVVTAMHGGKRSSPRRHGQEAQRGQDWLGRAWQVFSHHPLGPGRPRDPHFCPRRPDISIHWAPVVGLVLNKAGKTGSSLRSHGRAWVHSSVYEPCAWAISLQMQAKRPPCSWWHFLRAHCVPCQAGGGYTA